MRISDWSSDVCSSDLQRDILLVAAADADRTGIDSAMPCVDDDDALARLATLRSRRRRHRRHRRRDPAMRDHGLDRKSVGSGKSVSIRVSLGGRRIIKKQKKYHNRILEQINAKN